MKIQCENCRSVHDLEPPSWVIASGRPFRFRCSACGHSQMASPPTGIELSQSTLAEVTTAKPTPPRPALPPAPASPEPQSNQSVFLKQDGKVYLVRDWATLQRWIMENRVDRNDMVSEGGVNWDVVGSRPELGSFFAAIEKIEAAELAGIGLSQEGLSEDPPTSEARSFERLREPTEGVPIGLPPLPTEEIFDIEAPSSVPNEDQYPEQPPARGFSEPPLELEEDPESSTVEEPPSLELVADAAPPEASLPVEESPPESKVVDFPDLSFEPHLSAESSTPDIEAMDPIDPQMDLPDPADPPFIDSDFGDFGRFADDSESTGVGFDKPATETDIPESDPFPEDEEDDYLDPTELAPPADSFDDRFGQDDIDNDMMEIDNTEILEPEDPFADFGDFFVDEDEIQEPIKQSRRYRGVFLFAGILAAGALIGGGGYILLFGLPTTGAVNQLAALSTVNDEKAPKETEKPAPDEELPEENVTEPSQDQPSPKEEPSATEPVADATTTIEPTPDEPAPTVTPEPKEEVTEPSAPDEKKIGEWVDVGWKEIDKSRFGRAILAFEKVLNTNVENADANYGMGYALIKQGKRNDAQEYLCAAYNTVADDTSPAAIGTFRDVKGLLKNNQLACDQP